MGEMHPATAQAHFNLGTLLASSGKYQEAEASLLASRKILEKTLGPGNVHLVTVYETLSTVYEKMKKDTQAKEYAARVYRIRNPKQMKKPQNN